MGLEGRTSGRERTRRGAGGGGGGKGRAYVGGHTCKAFSRI